MQNHGVLLVLLVLSVAHTAGAGTYYADADAGAGGEGTQAKPFGTLQAAVDSARAGDVVLARGVFRETVKFAHSGTKDKPINVKPWPGTKAQVNGCDVVRVL